MLKTLLIDLDGVLRRWQPENVRYAERATGLPAGTILKAAFADDLLALAITGRITDRVWRRRVQGGLQASFPGADVQRAVALWSASPGEVSLETLELLRACRQVVSVVLVTNATSRLPEDLERLGLLGDFDAIVNSSSVGYAEPCEEIYRAALETAGAAPHEALFIDDSAQNVVAALELGLTGYVFDTPEGLRGTLCRVGLLEVE